MVINKEIRQVREQAVKAANTFDFRELAILSLARVLKRKGEKVKAERLLYNAWKNNQEYMQIRNELVKMNAKHSKPLFR